MPMTTAVTALILAGFDAYDAIARRRGIATLDPDAREEAIQQTVHDSEQKYAGASADLGDAIVDDRKARATGDDA